MNNQAKCTWCRFLLKILQGVVVFLVCTASFIGLLYFCEWISNQGWATMVMSLWRLLALAILGLSIPTFLFAVLVKMYREAKDECQ